jgi:hypothetical protein
MIFSRAQRSMEKINTYILQARQAGQTDEQIRQNLVAGGWQTEQVNQALGEVAPYPEVAVTPLQGQVIPGGYQPPAPAQGTSQPTYLSQLGSPTDAPGPLAQPTAPSPSPLPKRRNFKLFAAIGIVVAILIIASGASYALFFHKVSYRTVADDFVTAMEKGDKAKADSLVSVAGKAQLKKYAGSTSYYDYCKKTGATCTYYFSSKFLGKAAVTTKNEPTKNGVQKRQVIYTLKQSSSTKSTGCTSNGSSTQTLTIELEAKGKTWVVDAADPETNFSASLCPVSSDTTTTTTSGADVDSSDSNNRTPADGESLNQQGQRRPVQYLNICTAAGSTIYYSQGSPACLSSDTFTEKSSPSAPGTTYSSPCQTDNGSLRYVYISTTETCPAGTSLLFYNDL